MGASGRGMCVCASTLLLALLSAAAAPDGSATWVRAPQPQQTLHGLMTSIDDRLHTLEKVRWDTTLKQVEQRLESLETTIRRVDTAFQDRLDKLERSLNSKELKDELTVEKLSHKVRDILDTSYDRYNRRLGYTEERLEMSLNKVQMGVETSLNRIEKQQEDMQTDVSEAVTILEDLKMYSTTTDNKLNSTHKAIQQNIQSLLSPNQGELQRISGSLEQLGAQLNQSLTPCSPGHQSDGPHSPHLDLITTLRFEISTEANKFTTKINNIYNDLWRRIVSMESLVKELGRLRNSTHQEMLEEVRSLAFNDRRDILGDSQENFLEVALDALDRKLQRRLSELGRRVDDRFDTLSATQNLVMDSCFEGGICNGLETRLSQVLERIFDVYSQKIEGASNRTLDLDDLIVEMMGLVKTQHSQLLRTVTHNTNMVVTLAKDSSEASKLLHNTVTQLTEKSEYNFQELLDEIQEASNASNKICNETEKTNENKTERNDLIEIASKTLTETTTIATEPQKNVTKQHDDGILKITTDDIELLADNNTYSNQISSGVFKTSSPKVVDTSIMQVISMISPNFTKDQLDVLLQFLNSSVSVENLEAIIQNTEAESEEDMVVEEMSMEIYSPYTQNTTNTYDENSEGNDNIFLLSEMSGETESLSQEIDQDELKDMVLAQNFTQNTPELNITIILNTTKLEVSPEIKNQLRIYMILQKIKNGYLNTTEMQKKIQNMHNQSENQDQTCLPILQKLCYGVEKDSTFTMNKINNIMRDRLLVINNTISDTDMYEKIENICNTMTESLQMPNESNKLLFDNKK